MAKRMLVTGGAGFISHVAHEAGRAVRALDNRRLPDDLHPLAEVG